MFALVGLAGGLTFEAFGGLIAQDVAPGASSIVVTLVLPLVVADVAQCVVNAGLMAVVQRVRFGYPILTSARALLGEMGLSYIAFGLLAIPFAILWGPAGLGWFAAVLFLGPLFAARWAMSGYGQEVEAHERTIRALRGAIDARDPRGRGHGDIVGDLSERIALDLGLRPSIVGAATISGRLHDVGKLLVPARSLKEGTPFPERPAERLGELRRLLSGISFIHDVPIASLSRTTSRTPGGHVGSDPAMARPDEVRDEDERRDAILAVVAVADAYVSVTEPEYGFVLSPEAAVAALRARPHDLRRQSRRRPGARRPAGRTVGDP